VTTLAHNDKNAHAGGSPLSKHYFLLRRLHSLTGIVPIGVFLFPHLFTNSSIMWARWTSPTSTVPPVERGIETFQEEVNFIHSLPFLTLIEVFGIWAPLAFHAIFGVWFASQAKVNVQRYAYQDNWRYVWQRITGYVAFVFIFMHVASLRWGWSFGGLFPTFDPHHAASTTAEHFQQGKAGLLVAAFYLACVLAIVFHFANGLWTAGITWGLTLSAGAMKRWGQVCASIGIVLALAGVMAVYGFSTLDIAAAKEIEARRPVAEGGTDAAPMPAPSEVR
jgi:succinate dehydrogenase / fumarate reductase cytochrome b subunit